MTKTYNTLFIYSGGYYCICKIPSGQNYKRIASVHFCTLPIWISLTYNYSQ